MQLAIKEHPDFKSRITDNPLELLIEVEKAMHVPMKSAYPILTLIDTLSLLITIKQGDKNKNEDGPRGNQDEEEVGGDE